MLDKIAIALISPLGTSLLLGLFALMLAGRQHTRMAFSFGISALVWLVLWSLPVASNILRSTVEAKYPPNTLSKLAKAEAIVVLGGGVRPAELPAQTPNLSEAADRVWHGAQLFHAGKAPLLVLSGGCIKPLCATHESEAEAMRQLVTDLGVPENALLLENRSRNTRQNAEFTYALLQLRGVSQILLVTSALHMQRAVGLFEAQGFAVTPAATDHALGNSLSIVDWLPDSAALDGSAKTFKEIVGRIMWR